MSAISKSSIGSQQSLVAANSQQQQQQQQVQLGITPPISLDMPTPEELESTQQLCTVLEEMNIFETAEETVKRYHFR